MRPPFKIYRILSTLLFVFSVSFISSSRNKFSKFMYPPDTAAYRRCFQKLDGTFRPPVPKPEAAETTPLPPEPTLDAEPLSPLPDGGVICDPPAKPEE